MITAARLKEANGMGRLKKADQDGSRLGSTDPDDADPAATGGCGNGGYGVCRHDGIQA
jgi:hypothetical protein